MAAKMKGFFKGFKYITQIFVYREHELEIGYPTDVKHVTHIGWDNSSLNAPSWMNEFRSSSDFSSSSFSNYGSRQTSWADQVFVYPPDRDSVLQVTQDAYATCNTSSYIRRFDDGNTVFTFDHSGPYYFISGDANNCLKKESMVVVVMAYRGPKTPPAMPPSPPPSPSLSSPPPSSSSEAPPSPPPTESLSPPPATPTEAPPSPPSPSSAEVPPASASAPAPESSPPPPNGTSLKVVSGCVSLLGIIFGSLVLML